jgi:8-oxo-dGTP diphosphatase
MKRIIVLGAIIEKDGKILLARSKTGQGMAGKWEFPGGRPEPAEPEKDWLKKKIFEDMKAEIEVLDFFAETIYGMGKRELNLRCYMAKLLSDKINPPGRDSFVWAIPDKILDYGLSPADVKIANKLVYNRK